MYSRKRPQEEIPEEMTAVWVCTEEDCNGWMRDNFAFEETPTCGQCQSPMTSGQKMLPVLLNTNKNLKMLEKGILIKR